MFTVTYEWLKDLTDKEWIYLIQIISDSVYLKNNPRSKWDIPVDIFQINYSIEPNVRLRITNFLNRISTIEEEAIIIRNLIKFIFHKLNNEYSTTPNIRFLPSTSNNPFREISVEPARRVEQYIPLTDEDIKEHHIEMMKDRCFIINFSCETRNLSERLSQQRIEYQQELAQKDQTITNIQNAHEEFLNTQLHFYKLTKPNTFSQFEASNPPALEIGHFLNFLESQWQNKEQQIKQVKHHLTQWITLITNKNNHN